MDKKIRDAMILTITDPLDQKFEQMMALQNDAKEMIDDLCNEKELDEIVRMLKVSLRLQGEISELLAQEEESDECTCEDCGKKFKKGDEGDNEKVCLRCEANFIAQKNYDRENGHDDHEDDDEDWIDPAGGVHSKNEKDPAKQYE